MVIECHAPVRVDFAGAWTDVSYFAEPFGGATLNAAIQIYVVGSLEEQDREAPVLRNGELAVSGPSGKYLITSTPAMTVTYGSDIPAGSGLGTSATLNVVWLALARREEVTSREDRMRMAALAYDIEKTLGIIGGKQDQYASAVGGINLFEFTAEGVTCHPVELSEPRRQELERLLVLVYTGRPRLSSNIHRNVWGNFRAGREDNIRALFSLRESAYEARQALQEWDLEAFARIVTHQRHYMKRLDASTSNQQIEDLFALAEPHILGGKPCGAGGGGCLLFIAKSTAAKERLHEALRGLGLSPLDVQFDFEGLVVTRK